MTELPASHSKAESHHEHHGNERAPWPRISLSWLLALAFGGLVALSVGAVLTLSVRANFTNTLSLLNTRAIELIDGMERQIASEASQPERAVEALSALYRDGEVELEATPGRHAVLSGILHTAPAVKGILLFGRDGTSASLFRKPDGSFAPLPAETPAIGLRDLFDIDAIAEAAKPVWGRPVPIGTSLFHNVALPLKRGGRTEGMAIAVVDSEILKTMRNGARKKIRSHR